jgi:GAF domain-containing protein
VSGGRLTETWAWIAEHAAVTGTAVSLPVACLACVLRVDVAGIGVTVDGGAPVYATDPLAGRLQELQFTLGEGPGVAAVRCGFPVFVADLADAADLAGHGADWPVFAPAAVLAGARAMVAVPMTAGAIRVGAFTAHRTRPGRLDLATVTELFVFAEIALQLLLDERAGTPGGAGGWIGSEPSAWFEVHQAAGMISAQLAVGIRPDPPQPPGLPPS